MARARFVLAALVALGTTARAQPADPYGPAAESDAVLAYLYQHAENPLFQCRFRWTENAIAFWDNRCAQHRAMWDYWPHTRAGTRVTVKGERPV